MIDERDLDAAVAAKIIDPETRERLVVFARDYRRGIVGPDEEQFRLLTGFNDIFVTIAVGLVLFAVGSLLGQVGTVLGAAAVAAASWALAEYFTKRRRMALPSIVLLLSFVLATMTALTGLFTGATNFSFDGQGGVPIGIAAAAALTVGAAYLHWKRFMVPITVAAGAGALVVTLLATAAGFGLASDDAVLVLVALCGLGVFAAAMAADARDRARVTRWSDVAFWLHLLAAPLIVHPVFALAGLLDPTPAPGSAAAVIAVYAALTLVALAIDRRALLVSALGYVIYAVQTLLRQGDTIGAEIGVTALVIGVFLVVLSAGWRPIRSWVLGLLPAGVTERLPARTV